MEDPPMTELLAPLARTIERDGFAFADLMLELNS